MTLVVSDTSPLRALHHVKLIHLLPTIFGGVFITPAVANELVNPAGDFIPIDVSKFPFVEIRIPANHSLVHSLRTSLDAGEAESLALAVELGNATLLIDERKGREAAASASVPHIGVLGLLWKAKQMQLLPAIRPFVDRLRGELNFYISDKLYAHFMKLVDE